MIAYSPVANVRRPPVSDESSTRGLSADELRRLLATATKHSPRMGALVGLLILNGLHISEALGTQVTDYGHDQGHRTLKIKRKGGKFARVPLAPPVVRALDAYLEGRTTGPIFLAADGKSAYPYQSAFSQIRRLAKAAGIEGADSITPHSLRHSFATEALSLGAPLQDVQDALGHADPRTSGGHRALGEGIAGVSAARPAHPGAAQEQPRNRNALAVRGRRRPALLPLRPRRGGAGTPAATCHRAGRPCHAAVIGSGRRVEEDHGGGLGGRRHRLAVFDQALDVEGDGLSHEGLALLPGLPGSDDTGKVG